MKPIVHHGVELTVEKINTNRVKVHYRGFRVCEAKNRKACVKWLDEHEYTKEKFLEAVEAADRRILSREVWPKRVEEFRRIFGFDAPKCKYTRYFFGDNSLDVLKLDEMIGTPDNVSMEDHIREKYGQRAVDLCREMIGKGPDEEIKDDMVEVEKGEYTDFFCAVADDPKVESRPVSTESGTYADCVSAMQIVHEGKTVIAQAEYWKGADPKYKIRQSWRNAPCTTK